MKLLNVYKQGSINWFDYKCLFSYIHKLSAQKYTVGFELESWIKHNYLGITKRKPNEIS